MLYAKLHLGEGVLMQLRSYIINRDTTQCAKQMQHKALGL
jgi:hypothetical protein